MDDEASDILGGRSLPIVRGTKSGHWSDLSFSIKTASILGVALLACVVFARAWERFLRWKEDAYKLSMRRRHGIPDNDHRPFNVAYAAVVRARQDREAKEKAKEKFPKLNQKASAPVGAQSIRQRFSDTGAPRNMVGTWPTTTAYYADANSGLAARNYPTPSPTDPLNFADRYNPNTPSTHIPDPEPQPGPSIPNATPRWSSRSLNFTADAVHDRRKRVLDDEDDLEPVKKTRVEVEELIDGEEDAVWQHPVASGADGRTRGSKRGLGEDDYETNESTRTRDKRARKVLDDHTLEEIMVDEGTDGDEPTDLISIPRGRKRDRAEAGSTFGGDDSELALDEEDDGKNSRRRKRRTVMKRKSEAHSRGQKRDREAHDSEEDEIRVKKRASRKRREKNDGKEEAASDVSMTDSQISQDLLCKGRRIGEEWEANGFQWKVGLNGDRLRQALVKKARSKFVMPKDSQHPDREANLEVFVEMWLTEEQYKEAQDQHELAWQDSPKASAEPETPGNVPDSPSKPGKNLLWESNASKDSSTPKRGPFRQSIATNLGIRINPFEQSQYGPGRRVASSYPSPLTVDAINSTGSPKHRTFSKWEKQDLEAQAMAKMRAKVQEEKVKQAAAVPEVKTSCDTAGASTAAPAPSFTFPTPPVEKSAPTPTFGVPPTITVEVKAAEAAKPTTAVQPEAASFKLPTAMAEVPKPFFAAPVTQNSKPVASPSSVPNEAPPPSSSMISFGFQPTKPQQPNTITDNTFSSLNVPSGGVTKPSGPAPPPAHAFPPAHAPPPTPAPAAPAPAAPAPAPAPAPVPTFSQPLPTPVQQNAALKPPLFSFAPTSNRGSSSSPQVPLGTQGTKTPSSIFGTQNVLPKKPEEKSGDGGSLVSRMGGFSGPQTVQPSASGSTSFGVGNNLFSFTKPNPPATGGTPIKPPIFGVSTTPQSAPIAPTAAPTASGSGAPSTVKFDFGFKTPNASPNPGAASTASTSSPSRTAQESFKPSSGSFTFGVSPTPKSTLTEAVPKFNSSSGSVFGSTSSMEGSKIATVAPSVSSQNDQSKPAFGGFGAGAASTAPFSSFGGGGNVFGSLGTTPAQSSQSATFPFPSTNATFANPSAFTSNNVGAPKSAFSNLTESSKPLGQSSNPTNDPQTSSPSVQPPVNDSSTSAPTPSSFGFPSTSGMEFKFGQQ